jgi:hypothetical protein
MNSFKKTGGFNTALLEKSKNAYLLFYERTDLTINDVD